MKLPTINIKAFFKAILINWWWGFWRRKPKVSKDSFDTIFLDVESDMGVHPMAPVREGQVGGVLEEACRIVPMSKLWNKRRVVILDGSDDKVGFIKLIRRLSGLGLKDSKAFVDSCVTTNMRIIGPFKNATPKNLVEALELVGALAVIATLDQDFDFAYEFEGENEYFEPAQDDIDNLYISIDLDDHDFDNDEDLEWLDDIDEDLEGLDDIGDDLVEEDSPEDFIFGHEDTELQPH